MLFNGRVAIITRRLDMKEYRTNALPLASYLSCIDDLEFVGVDRQEPGRVVFIFEPYLLAVEKADDYFAGRAQVDPLELFKSYRSLKDLVFEVKRNAEFRSK